MTRSRRLKELLSGPDPLVLTGAPSVAMARMMEAIGFRVNYMGATAIVGRTIGLPDDGTITMSESVMFAKWFVDGTSLPVWVDADVCFGGPAQVRRAVAEYVRVGVAGVTIEDQVPHQKRFGGSPGKEILAAGDAVEKYRSAVEVRNAMDPDLQLGARTDALHATNSRGLTETIDRLLAYKEAGVDVLYLEAPTSIDEIVAVRAAVPGPLICTTFKLPRDLSVSDARDLGLAGVFSSRWRSVLNRFAYVLLHGLQNEGPSAVERLAASIPAVDDPDFLPNDGTSIGDVLWSFKWTGSGVGQPTYEGGTRCR